MVLSHMKKENTSTNPIGPGTTNLTVNVPNQTHKSIKALAKKSNMKLGEYVRRLLAKAMTSNTTFSTVEVTDK